MVGPRPAHSGRRAEGRPRGLRWSGPLPAGPPGASRLALSRQRSGARRPGGSGGGPGRVGPPAGGAQGA
eukprot:11051074-Lingulodinium_polyedra.AAC.1